MKGNWQSIHRFSHFLSKTVKKFAVFSFLNVFFVIYVVDWRYCSLPPLRLHSPVQCCLIKMPQGSTVKRLNAKRKRPAGGAGGELDRSTLNKSPFKNNLTHQTKKSHHWPHWEHTSWWWSRCCWWWWPALLWPGPLWTPTPSSLWTSCCRNYKSQNTNHVRRESTLEASGISVIMCIKMSK